MKNQYPDPDRQEEIVTLARDTDPEAFNPEQLGRDWRQTLETEQRPKNFGRNWRVTL